MKYTMCYNCGGTPHYENVCQHDFGDEYKESCIKCCDEYDCADFYGSNWIGERCKCGQPLDKNGNENYEKMCEHDGCHFCCQVCKQIASFELNESKRVEEEKKERGW